MKVTAALFAVAVLGLAVMAASSVGMGSLPDCGAFGPLEGDAVDACFAEVDPQRRFFATVFSVGFGIMAIGALGLLGRYTGLLRT